jgi:hypothetical protein
MLYQVVKQTPLSTGQRYGDVVSGDRFQPATLDRLVAGGVLTAIQTPPLSVLPGWSRRAEKLAGAGVHTVEQLLDMDDAKLATLFNQRGTKNARRWKEEAAAFLKLPDKPIKG